MQKCELPSCTHEFEERPGKKYCSNICRAKASVRNRVLGELPEDVKPQNIAARPSSSYRLPTGPDHQSQYIINHLTKESERWENLYKKEKEKRETLKEKKEELEKKILTMENEQRIAAIENTKPSGLSGLMSTPAGEKLLEAAAPLIQRLLEPRAPQQIAGPDGNETPAQAFMNWFGTLSMQGQNTVWNMLQIFTIMPEADLVPYCASVIAQLKPAYSAKAS